MHTNDTAQRTYTNGNALRNEKSPYLLQHANNPVDWLPWSDEAFLIAKERDCPVFVSIGYSTCHWCHVMERESFEDTDVAAYLNEHFISIKVDKEEHPDIDVPLMAVCQAISGRAGHPLTAFLTPDGKPFFAGTYFPKYSSQGRMGFVDLLKRIDTIWHTEKDRVLFSADEIIRQLSAPVTVKAEREGLENDIILSAVKQLEQRYDNVYGGFNQQPKFPLPHSLIFLLRSASILRDTEVKRMAETTLQAMRFGGIYDHVGYGFHRYSTDRLWLVPHFEKMLYDQALLVMAYSEAYSCTGQELYKRVVTEVITYLQRELMSGNGLFYTAEDADSEGQEGKYYVWSLQELNEILSEDDVQFLKLNFNISQDGNFLEEATGHPTGMNIPHIRAWHTLLAERQSMLSDDWEAQWLRIQTKLLARRSERIRPLRDEKILCDWNALMVVALCRASRCCQEPQWLEMALEVLSALEKEMYVDGQLYHRSCQGERKYEAHLDDYASFLWAYLECASASGDNSLLAKATSLCELVYEKLYHQESNGLVPRRFPLNDSLPYIEDAYDGAIPSPYSIIAYCCEILALLDGSVLHRQRADAIYTKFADQIRHYPSGYTMMLNAYIFSANEPEIMHIHTASLVEYRQIRNHIDSVYHPLRIVKHDDKIHNGLVIRVCTSRECHTELHSEQELLEYLRGTHVW